MAVQDMMENDDLVEQWANREVNNQNAPRPKEEQLSTLEQTNDEAAFDRGDQNLLGMRAARPRSFAQTQSSFVDNAKDLVGWSSTRGIATLDENDFEDEFGAFKHVMRDTPTLTDLVRKQPEDKMSKSMDELTNSWMSDPNSAAVDNRLQALDQEGWALSANQASRSTLREYMTDLIDDEMDKFTQEKAEAASFHGDKIPNYNDKEFVPPPYRPIPGW